MTYQKATGYNPWAILIGRSHRESKPLKTARRFNPRIIVITIAAALLIGSALAIRTCHRNMATSHLVP